jgi:hypothetical protein
MNDVSTTQSAPVTVDENLQQTHDRSVLRETVPDHSTEQMPAGTSPHPKESCDTIQRTPNAQTI